MQEPLSDFDPVLILPWTLLLDRGAKRSNFFDLARAAEPPRRNVIPTINPMRNVRGKKNVKSLMLLFEVQISCLLGAPDLAGIASSPKVEPGGKKELRIRRKHEAIMTE